mgnify:CR=1 FL=1
MSITKEEYQNKEKEQLLKKQKKEYKEEEYCPLWILFFGFLVGLTVWAVFFYKD